MRFEQKLSILLLFTALVLNTAWAEDQSNDTSNAPSQPSHIEGWDDIDDHDDWTWFGIGYERRQALSSSGGSGAGGSGGKKGGSRSGK